MKELGHRIADKSVMHLIKMWLEAPVEEKDEKTGKARRTTENKDNRRGSPQGSPISLLLSNIYMSLFIKQWKKRDLDRKHGAEIVNYADDLVICCRRNAEEAMRDMRAIMEEPWPDSK
ncbi:MAG: hypothetical protein LBP92_03970 [Deltaproteobacteria bacterium]|jgi:retron-type reverse transcriptase|nr:hypothetical protein [Deltaproteobacteria bacterium]